MAAWTWSLTAPDSTNSFWALGRLIDEEQKRGPASSTASVGRALSARRNVRYVLLRIVGEPDGLQVTLSQ